MPLSITYNDDCMNIMSKMKDKEFDLAIVDPPYGGGQTQESEEGLKSTRLKKSRSRFGARFDKYKIERTGGTWSKKYQDTNNIKHWDIAPDDEYFQELFRISKNQIVWGGNYFGLPPNRHFLIWRKLTISEKFSMAMCEYAWSSFNENSKIFEYQPQDSNRFHPTQKPVALYQWLLTNYAKPNDKIFDSHLGSGSSRIACYELGFDFIGVELDKNYFEAQEKRFELEKAKIDGKYYIADDDNLLFREV